jgi:hypothetical protein
LPLANYGQSVIGDKEYDVYNFILKKEFINHQIDKSNGTPQPSKIIPGAGKERLTSNKDLELRPEKYKDVVDSATYSKFMELNKNTYPLQTEKITISAYSKSAYTFVSLSRCYVQDDLAIVSVGIQYDLSEGEGYVYFLKRDPKTNSWKIVKTVLQWIS